MDETPRQRFIRNAGENARVARAVQLRLQREGRLDDAARVGELQDKWDEITAEAQRQEDAGSTETGPNTD